LPAEQKITIDDLNLLFPATDWSNVPDKPINAKKYQRLRDLLLPVAEIADELNVPASRLVDVAGSTPSNSEQYPAAMQKNRAITRQEILDGINSHQSIIRYAVAENIPPVIIMARIGRYCRGKNGPQLLDQLPEQCRCELAMGQSLANWEEMLNGASLAVPKASPIALLIAYMQLQSTGVVITRESLAEKIGLPPDRATKHWGWLAKSGLLPPSPPPSVRDLAAQMVRTG
jgi:hypothetical protein